MADDEKTPETAETAAEPEAGAIPAAAAEETAAVQEPAADEAAAEPTPEAVAEATPATGAETSDAAVQNPPREKKPKSRKHVPRSARRQRPKVTRETPTARKPIVRGERAEIERGRRPERRGVVVSDKGDKTIVVKVDVIKLHPKYKKVVRSTVKFHAHDERNEAGAGDTVRIVETRPLSKTKNWRLAEVLQEAK